MNERILLTEKDFIDLVNGKVVDQGGIKIALQDIGADRMKMIVDEFYEKLLG